MSKKIQSQFSCIAIFLALFMVLGLFTACDTSVGEQGPQGEQGIPGKDGEDGKSAYELAVEKGYTDIVKLLLEQKGIDINSKDINFHNLIFILII